MLHIREVSDLHIEFDSEFYDVGHEGIKEKLTKLIPPLKTDKKTVLIVAGDLGTAHRPQRIATFFEIIIPRFKHVIYVLGNHEHYGMYMSNTLPIIEDVLENRLGENFKKITIVGNEPVRKIIGKVTFLCGTMWTDYGAGLSNMAEIRNIVGRCINDHVIIKSDVGGPTPPADLALVFLNTVSTFDAWLREGDNSKTVVVTHHLPSFQAVHARYKQDPRTALVNHAFASNLDDFITQHQPAIWFFGHTHIPYNGTIGKTILHCNPYGYPHEPTAAQGIYDSSRVYSL